MKHFLHASLLSVSLILIAQMRAQTSEAQGGEYIFNESKTPCLTQEQYEVYHQAVTNNKEMLDMQGKRVYSKNSAGDQVLFDWPIKQATGFDYDSTWAISNYVDHNPASGQLSDWNCGERTYDTSSGYDHAGIDIFLWPFTWKQVDDNQTEVIAAQNGQIVYKNDGEFDRSCALNGNLWNAIFVEHSDGSVAWYGHMKNGSLNTKSVGDVVNKGEYLGIVASSGNSTGPHLHFEVYDADNNLIDPYEGPCNNLNTNSWWGEQKPYLNTKFNALLTHSAPPQFFDCGTTEEPNIESEFLPGDEVIVAAYYADQMTGTTASYEVVDPNGTVQSSWTQTFNNDFYASYWYWTIQTSEVVGIWEFKATYNGETAVRQFANAVLSTDDSNLLGLALYPNPVSTVLTINTAELLDTITVRDLTGRIIATQKAASELENTVDFSAMRNGVYFVTGTSLENGASSTLRVVKK